MGPYPLYLAEGDHRELGRSHGRQARDQIKSHIEYLGATLKLTRDGLCRRAMGFDGLFQKHCNDLCQEIAGLGEGAGVSYAEALAVNIRGALSQVADGGCTAFAISGRGTQSGEVLIGQNSDQLPPAMDLAYVLHLQPIGKPEVLMWTFGGMIGYHGINSLGIAHFANDLGGGPSPRMGLPHYPLKRLLLESRSIDECQRLLSEIPLWASGNYVLSDGQGAILDIEVTPEGAYPIVDHGSGYLAHSNHFLCKEQATEENHRASAKDSFTRLTRIEGLIEARMGRLTVEDCKAILRDRAGGPCGICREATTDHPDADWRTAGVTVASIIAEPAQRRLHIARGNQSDTPFVTYAM